MTRYRGAWMGERGKEGRRVQVKDNTGESKTVGGIEGGEKGGDEC